MHEEHKMHAYAWLQIDTPAMVSFKDHKLKQAGAALTSKSGSAEHSLKAASYAAASAGSACTASNVLQNGQLGCTTGPHLRAAQYWTVQLLRMCMHELHECVSSAQHCQRPQVLNVH